jgi:repressor LexA
LTSKARRRLSQIRGSSPSFATATEGRLAARLVIAETAKIAAVPAAAKQQCDNQNGGIPLAGRVAAGLPVEAVENKDYLSIESCFGNTGNIFALEVKGDSMIGENIREGDYVICKRTAIASNGQLVVAIVDNEDATLKRFYREDTKVRLQPANDSYEPIYSDNCRIEGVVIGLVRKL